MFILTHKNPCPHHKQVPAILLCQDFDEASILKVPSSPPRRLSRSSIDLRDLEAQHEREKIMSQNVSESVSSIYHCFDNQMLRYSGSEPINANIINKVLENQFSMKCDNNKDDGSDRKQNSTESKSSVNNFSYTNNLEHSLTRENDLNLISSASIIKDNQVANNANGCSYNNINNINNNIVNSSTTQNSTNNNNNNNTNSSSSSNGIGSKKSFKKKKLASSDSDFFSLLRYNSEKLRRMNCFSIGTSTHSNGNKPKNMIYALSDSDFLIGVSDKSNKLHLNNERKIQAIVNKSDIFNYLNKSFDHKNLLDNNFAQHNQKLKLSDIDGKKHFDNPDFFNVDKLKKVFEESKIDSEKSNVDDTLNVQSDKLQKKETVSLPPLVNSTSNDLKLKLNNSRSIDTVLLNIKNNTDKLYTFKLLYDFSPKSINQDENLTKNLLKDAIQHQNLNVADSSNNASNGVLQSSNGNNLTVESISSILKPVNLNDSPSNQPLHQNQDIPTDQSGSNIKCCDTIHPVYLDDKNMVKRKRTPSTVTYNVNVIDFQTEDDSDVYHSGTVGGSGYGGGVGGGNGKRSNSSTSKYSYLI